MKHMSDVADQLLHPSHSTDIKTNSVTSELLSDKAYRVLEEQIVTLVLAPGTMLTEGKLAAELGIGRTPVREALQRLAREGLVVFLPARGILVSEIDTKAHLRLLEVRRRLEGLVANLAAQRASPAQRQRFQELNELFGTILLPGDELEFMRLDREFNQLILESAHNPYCANLMGLIQGLSRRFFFRYKSRVDLALTARLHGAIAKAIHERNPGDAERAVNALIDHNESFAIASLQLP
jgi:DNA-binding GntR family transcriptional regulator